MFIESSIHTKQTIFQAIKELLKKEFRLNENIAKELIQSRFRNHVDSLKDTLFFYVETNYVDKFYRDTYYNYFSSKSGNYKRDCIKISYFVSKIQESNFREADSIQMLRESYLGFTILRPTISSIIGRGVISPYAFKKNSFYARTTKIPITVNGVKFEAEGFPHSSQDSENITCAETSLWSVMEYFGNRYSEYSPKLPSLINTTLRGIFHERQVPSKGLNIYQISYALKEFGFGSIIYSKKAYDITFDRLLSTYIESGIPIILAFENKSIAHALVAIGHGEISDSNIDKLPVKNFAIDEYNSLSRSNNIEIYDSAEIEKEFIFVDDNHPCYQKGYLNNPARYYANSLWDQCEITYFIAPLYSKIYLEAYEARNFFFHILLKSPYKLNPGSKVVLRTFLTSSRSYKDLIAVNKNMDPILKEIIIKLSMPKFIWVGEISTKELYQQRLANGLILLDATEANNRFLKPLILQAHQGRLRIFDEEIGFFKDYQINLESFIIYTNNLKYYIN